MFYVKKLNPSKIDTFNMHGKIEDRQYAIEILGDYFID